MSNFRLAAVVQSFILALIMALQALPVYAASPYLGLFPVFKYYTGNNVCSYKFVLDATGENGDPIRDVLISMVGKDKGGAKLGDLTLKVPMISDADVARYADATVEGSCRITSFTIIKATAKINDTNTDLVTYGILDLTAPKDLPTMSTSTGAPSHPLIDVSQTPAEGATESKPKEGLLGLLKGQELLPCNSPALMKKAADAMADAADHYGHPEMAVAYRKTGMFNFEASTNPQLNDTLIETLHSAASKNHIKVCISGVFVLAEYTKLGLLHGYIPSFGLGNIPAEF